MKPSQYLLLALITCLPLPAEAKPARCVIQQNQATVFAGPCQFQAFGGDGSFSLTKAGGGPLLPEITDVSVSITAPNQAEVRGLTTSGIQSRWGPAQRSSRDPACWVGADFKICAY